MLGLLSTIADISLGFGPLHVVEEKLVPAFLLAVGEDIGAPVVRLMTDLTLP